MKSSKAKIGEMALKSISRDFKRTVHINGLVADAILRQSNSMQGLVNVAFDENPDIVEIISAAVADVPGVSVYRASQLVTVDVLKLPAVVIGWAYDTRLPFAAGLTLQRQIPGERRPEHIMFLIEREKAPADNSARRPHTLTEACYLIRSRLLASLHDMVERQPDERLN